MPGFLGVIGSKAGNSIPTEKRVHLVVERKSGSNWVLERRTLNKFLLDKPFYDDDNYTILVEGVILNRKTIEAKYSSRRMDIQRDKSSSFADAIIDSYTKNGETFFNEFRGSFSGAFFDKRKNVWLIYTDHIGDKQIFYSEQNGNFVFGSETGFVINFCKQNSLPLTLNEVGANMILTYGFFIETHTLANEIKRLSGGYYLKITGTKTACIQYHMFKNEPDYKTSHSDFIEEVEHHFKNAIALQFEKDKEYNYKHVTTLSGGLDSRMTVWVAHEMGYTDMLNTTFSQSNYYDEVTPKKIASDLKHDWLFKFLDGGNFLKDIDDVARITYGGAAYFGLAHGKSLYDLVDFTGFGMMHTGQFGDKILGTSYPKAVIEKSFKIGEGANSTSIIDRLRDYKFEFEYPNLEIFRLYTRAFTGTNQGLLVFQEKTESSSPFLDVEFLSFAYSIPVEMRFRHKIYIDWVLKHHPGAADYVWERTKQKIKPVEEVKTVNILGKNVPRDRVYEWMAGAVKRRSPFRSKHVPASILASPHHMNPIDYWYQTNPDLKLFLDNYFTTNIDLVQNKKMREDCMYLYNECAMTEKLLVLTLLSGLKLFYS